MEMTQEKAIKRLKTLKARCERLVVSSDRGPEEWRKDAEAVDFALTALRPVSREQVEKVWRGEWNQDEHGRVVCNRCGSMAAIGTENALHNAKKYDRFCFYCGAPMTDEAVEMVMERLNKMEEMKK